MFFRISIVYFFEKCVLHLELKTHVSIIFYL